MKAIFSVDTEDTASGGYEGTYRFLELFDRLGIVATFFVVGEFAQKYPRMVDDILRGEHEVACHGWDHPSISVPITARSPFISQLPDNKVREQLSHTIKVLTRKNIRPVGFRAPWLCLSDHKRRVISSLFSYDSSSANRKPSTFEEDLKDLPISSLCGHSFTFSSSMLFALPIFAQRTLINRFSATVSNDTPLMLYTHSFDLMRQKIPLYTGRIKRAYITTNVHLSELSILKAGYMSLCGTMLTKYPASTAFGDA